MLDRLLSTQCIRPGCGHRNPKGSEYCEKCGISLAFSRPAILDGNRWSPAPDELAAFFRFKAMQGFFTKTLHVPQGMRAWVLQGDANDGEPIQLPEGEHTTETLFQRLNNFFRSPHGEVLVSRTVALPVKLSWADIPSAELLPLTTSLTLHVRIADVQAFRRRFLLTDGVVTVTQVAQLIGPAVRQALGEVTGTLHADEMAADPNLRERLVGELRRRMSGLLTALGLQIDEISEFELHHDALDELRQLRGRLWLVRREMHVRGEHDKGLDEIYDQAEWAGIRRREADLRRRRASGELTQEEAELAHTLRLRDLDRLERILQADTREQALRLGAGEQVEILEEQAAARRREREHAGLNTALLAEGEAETWRHVQALARLRRDTELRVAQARRDEEAGLERLRVDAALERVAAQEALERARRADDETERQLLMQQHLERLAKAGVRDEQLLDRRHEIALHELDAARKARVIEAESARNLEDAQLRSRIEALRRESKVADNKAELSGLRELLDIESQSNWDAQTRELDRRRQESLTKIQETEAAFVQEEKRHRLDMEAEAARRQAELERTTLLGSLPPEALIVHADQPEKIAALVKLSTTKVHIAMSPEQIRASQGMPAGPAPQVAPAAGLSHDAVDQRVQQHVASVNALSDKWADRLERQQRENNEVVREFIRAQRDGNVTLAANVGIRPVAPVPTPPPVAVFQAVPPPPQPPFAPAAVPVGHVPLALKSCPHCYANNLADAKVCGHCGKTFA